MRTRKTRKNRRDFLPREHYRQPSRCLRRHDLAKPRQLKAEHLSIHEQQRTLGLVLRRGRHISFHCQVGQKCFDLRRTQFGGMLLAVKKNEASNPIDIDLFGTDAVVLDANFVANPVEQARRGR